MPFCTDCGKELPERALFCIQCGKKLESVQPTHHIQSQKPVSSKSSTPPSESSPSQKIIPYEEAPTHHPQEPDPEISPTSTLKPLAPKKKKKSRKWLWMGIGITFLGFILVGGLLGIGGLLWFFSEDSTQQFKPGSEEAALIKGGSLSDSPSEWIDFDPSKIDEDFNVGVISSTDTNGDGIEDKHTLSFEKEEVADKLYIDRNVEYVKQDDGSFKGVMTLNFDDKGHNGDYTHREVIPKEFASHISKLKFSREPDRIINPDPEVEFDFSSKEFDSGGGDLKEEPITITSTETKTEDTVKGELQATAVQQAISNCQDIRTEGPFLMCYLEAIRKYRDNPWLEKNLSQMNVAEMPGALIVSVFRGDYRYCKQVSGEEYEACTSLAFWQHLKDCNQLTGVEKEKCIRLQMWGIKDIDTMRNACHFISDGAMKDECLGRGEASRCDAIPQEEFKDRCILNYAAISRDTDLCQKVKDETFRASCLYIISRDTKNEKVCELMDHQDYKDECYYELVQEIPDLRICAKIKRKRIRDGCITGVMLLSNSTDAGACLKIEDLDIRDICILSAIKNGASISYCDRISEADTKAICKLLSDIKAGDFENLKCDRYKDNMSRDLCWMIRAGFNNDTSFCDRITDDDLKEICIKTIRDAQNTTPSAGNETCAIPAGASLKNLFEYNGYAEYYYSKDNKRVGPYVRWWDNEKTQKQAEGCYNLKGEKIGTWNEWDREGENTKRMNYKSGVLDGLYLEWSEGYLLGEKSYKDGKLDGAETVYHRKSEVVSRRTQWSDGVKNGRDEEFFRDGSQSKITIYEKGEWAGKSTEYWEDGTVKYQRDGEMRLSSDGKKRFYGEYYSNQANAPPTLCREEGGIMEDCEYVAAR
ncbi:MAG: zinc-ribbon domain-containing protein [Candidatus Altiarchaeota archaeon]